jgi:hypothetical protein
MSDPFSIISADKDVLFRWDERSRKLLLRGSGQFVGGSVLGSVNISDSVQASLDEVSDDLEISGSAQGSANKVSGKVVLSELGRGKVVDCAELHASGESNCTAAHISAYAKIEHLAYLFAVNLSGGLHVAEGGTAHIEGSVKGDMTVEQLGEVKAGIVEGNVTLEGESRFEANNHVGEMNDNRENQGIRI